MGWFKVGGGKRKEGGRGREKAVRVPVVRCRPATTDGGGSGGRREPWGDSPNHKLLGKHVVQWFVLQHPVHIRNLCDTQGTVHTTPSGRHYYTTSVHIQT